MQKVLLFVTSLMIAVVIESTTKDLVKMVHNLHTVATYSQHSHLDGRVLTARLESKD